MPVVPFLLLNAWPILFFGLLLVNWVHFLAQYHAVNAAIGYGFLMHAFVWSHFVSFDLALVCCCNVRLWETSLEKAWLGVVVIWGGLAGFVFWLIGPNGWTLVIWGNSYVHLAAVLYLAVAVVLWVLGRRVYLLANALHEKRHGALSLLAYLSFWVMTLSNLGLSSLMLCEVARWVLEVTRIGELGALRILA